MSTAAAASTAGIPTPGPSSDPAPVSPSALPERARVVVIGGGVIGTSIAYHLAHLGWTDVVVLERDRLTSGTTWHAAGLMTCFGSTSHTSTAIRLYGRDLYARLEAETGLATGFKPVGLIEAAADEGRLHEYRRIAAFQRTQGLEVHEITPREIADLFPLAKTDDLAAGFYVPGDGRVNPVDLTMSLARGAKQLGVRIIEGVSVESVVTHNNRVTAVRVTQGDGTADIECEYAVNAAGMWARELGQRNGVVIPNQAAEHYYLITEPIDGVSPDAPVFEDPAAYGYYREEGGGLMVGLFEPRAAAWKVGGIPQDFSFGTLEPDWERMEPFLRTAMERVPVTLDAGIRTFFCGPESFTPDLLPAVGEAPGIRGYFVCAGLNSIGILSSGGMGRLVAQWITSGHPDADVTAFNVDRFQAWQLAPRLRAERTSEVLGTVYAAHAPGTQLRSGRGIKRSPLHDKLIAQGAYLKDVSGWESPDWYAAPGTTPTAQPSWHHEAWFDQWRAEHEAVRTGVVLIDMSFMAKFIVEGPDAATVLDRISAGPVAGQPGRIVYTQWLNDTGGIEADLTVTRLADDRFLVVASDTAHGHVAAWLARHTDGADARVSDVTATYAQVNIQGPRSREVMAAASDDDFSPEGFAFRDARWVHVGNAPVLAIRITYVGELGWELYIPVEHAGHVYETLVAAGEPIGLRHVGLKALGSLRMEKAYRDYGHDIDNTDNLAMVGLGFAVAKDKPVDWIGRGPTLEALAAGPPQSRLVQVLLADPEPLLFHAEILLRDGVAVGDVRSGSYGWTLGGAVGLAMVTNPDGPATADWLSAGTWEVDIAGQRYAARVSLRPLYDPTSARVNA